MILTGDCQSPSIVKKIYALWTEVLSLIGDNYVLLFQILQYSTLGP